jgi:hypothetical protein
MTRALLNGVGMLKSHTAAKQEIKSETTNVLRVEITLPKMPPGTQTTGSPIDGILAAPRRPSLASHVDSIPAALNSIDGEVL